MDWYSKPYKWFIHWAHHPSPGLSERILLDFDISIKYGKETVKRFTKFVGSSIQIKANRFRSIVSRLGTGKNKKPRKSKVNWIYWIICKPIKSSASIIILEYRNLE